MIMESIYCFMLTEFAIGFLEIMAMLLNIEMDYSFCVPQLDLINSESEHALSSWLYFSVRLEPMLSQVSRWSLYQPKKASIRKEIYILNGS